MATLINSYRYGFNPLTLSPTMWLDASDSSTITTATGVSQWRDKGTNAFHITQATGANQPAYSGTQNGLNVVTFDGSNDTLSTGNISISQPMTLLVVAKVTNNTGQAQITGAAGVEPVLYRQITSNFWSIYAGSAVSSSTANDLGVHQFTAVFNGASSSLRLDGSQIASGAVSGGAYAATAMTFGGNPSSNYMAGFIAEVIICGTLASVDRDAIEAYLKAKWGTP